MNKASYIKLCKKTYWDQDSMRVIYDNEIVPLTDYMTKCLYLLIQQVNRPIASSVIFDDIWNSTFDTNSSKKVRSLISDLRKRIPCLNIVNHYGGYYSLQKYQENCPDIQEYIFDILDQTEVGITITDPNQEDNPAIYVNDKYTQMFGYEPEDILGKNLRYLQNSDNEQVVLEDIRIAIEKKIPITTIVRNYHKSGELIYNELTISPIFDKKTLELKYFIGIQKDVTTLYNLINKVK